LRSQAVDGFDPERDFPNLNEVPRYREWDELMRTLQERAPEAKPNDWWAPISTSPSMSRLHPIGQAITPAG
jgi:hypothetical protein